MKSLTKEEIKLLQEEYKKIYVSEEILDIVQEILKFTRESSLYVNGLSTRAAITLLNISKAWALVSFREFVIPSDVLEVLPYVTRHRLISKADRKTPSEIVDEVIENLHIDT